MSNNTKTLSEQVRALSSRDRITLVEDALASLDQADPNIDRLWTRERAPCRLSARRLKAIRLIPDPDDRFAVVPAKRPKGALGRDP